MKKRIVALAVLAVFALFAAYGETAEKTDAYASVDMGMKLEEVSRLLGAHEEREEGILAFPGGVLLSFYESGRIRAKALDFEDDGFVQTVEKIPLQAVQKLKQGALYEDVTALMGTEGTEIMRINLSDEDTPGVRRVLAWRDEAGMSIQALFELDSEAWVLFAVAGIEESAF